MLTEREHSALSLDVVCNCNADDMERRLTAILAADVVGYSRLMGADEAGTLAQLKTVRGDVIEHEIAGHQGRIVKLTGDGILAEFPSVVNAVACAVEMQRRSRGTRCHHAGPRASSSVSASTSAM